MDDKDLIIQRLQNDIDKLEDEPKFTHSNLVDRNCMRRLIDADVFWEDLCENAEKGLMQSDSIEEVLNRQPTIEVVHCKECKHRPKQDINGEIVAPKRKRVADWSCPCIRDGICITDDDFFCKAGERR